MGIISNAYRGVTPFCIRRSIYRHTKQWRESKEVARILVERYHLKNGNKVFWDIYFSWYRFGATAEDYLGFDFLHKDRTARKEYFTEGDNEKYLKLMSDEYSCNILRNKHLFNAHFASLIHRDWVLVDASSVAALETMAKKHKSVVVKPFNTGEGEGVERLTLPKDEQRLRTLIDACSKGTRLMVEEEVENCKEMKNLNPNSVNTLRIITLRHGDGHIEIRGVWVRVGTGDGVADNLCKGGVCIPVDLSTNSLAKSGFNNRLTSFAVHPTTGITFSGYKLPFVSEAIDICKKACEMLPEAKYVGWDIIPTNKGMELLEGNIPLGEVIPQMFETAGIKSYLLKVLRRK